MPYNRTPSATFVLNLNWIDSLWAETGVSLKFQRTNEVPLKYRLSEADIEIGFFYYFELF